MSTYKPAYSVQFKEQMVELVRTGRKPVELAREFGYHVSSILGWVRHADESTVTPAVSAPLSTAERQELLDLRRKLRQVQMERDILAKATAWFAGKSEKTFTTSTNS